MIFQLSAVAAEFQLYNLAAFLGGRFFSYVNRKIRTSTSAKVYLEELQVLN